MSERRITREEAIERVELHLRGRTGYALGTQKKAEKIVEAIGAWEEEDKPPELPEGWEVATDEGFVCLHVPGWKGGGRMFGTDVPADLVEDFRAYLASALAALRQDDGEIELVVPLKDALDVLSDGSFLRSGGMERAAVRARRVRS
jgi:hypothetical protein